MRQLSPCSVLARTFPVSTVLVRRCSRRSSRRNQGVTLLEVLASLALAMLLCGALAGVLRGGLQQKRLIENMWQGTEWKETLRQRLLEDLTVSTQYLATPNRLVLVGPFGRHRETGQPTGEPARIEYFLADGGWLLRRSQVLSAGKPTAVDVQLAAAGVTRLLVGRADYDDRDLMLLQAATGQMFSPSTGSLRFHLQGANGETLIEGFVWRGGTSNPPPKSASP